MSIPRTLKTYGDTSADTLKFKKAERGQLIGSEMQLPRLIFRTVMLKNSWGLL